MDRSKDHRIFLDRSNSFLHPSCPYWFGPSPLRCAPVVLIKQQAIYPPQNEARQKKTGRKERKEEREDKEEKTERKKTSDSHCDKRKTKEEKNRRHHIRKRPLRHMVSTYLLHGHMKMPQHFPKSFKFFSASFMSWLIWFMPSSTRSSCSGQDKGMTAVEWILLPFCFLWKNEHYQGERSLSRGDSMHLSGSTDSKMTPTLKTLSYIKIFPSKV